MVSTVYLGGTAVSDAGVVQTIFLADDESVPTTAVFLGGIAHAPTGERYICATPSGSVTYLGGRAIRSDGAQVCCDTAAAPSYLGGFVYSSTGELLISADGTVSTFIGGIGLTSTGATLVSEGLFSIDGTLFGNGEEGVWFDPSDFSTMFQDDAGSTPVTAVEQTVGKILDKSGNGNHATQATAGSRPVLRARYNLLTYSEDFTNAVWTTYALTKNGATTGPDGSNTARLVTFTGQYGSIFTLLSTPVTSGLATGSVWIKRISGNTALVIRGSTSGSLYQTPITITDEWQQFTSPWAHDGTNTIGELAVQDVNAAGHGQIAIWHPHMNSGSSPGTYQRIAAATDYDTVGFMRYRDYDAVDDSMVGTNPDLGTDATIARAIPGVGASILQNQTIGANYSDTTDSGELILLDRPLTAAEETLLTAYLNAKAGV